MAQPKPSLDVLRGISFLKGVADADLERLAGISTIRTYKAREVVFSENENAHEVFLVIRGGVSVAICAHGVGCRQITVVGEGELLGWSPLVHRRLLSATAYTMSPTEAVTFGAQALLQLCEERPQFGFQFMHRTAEVLAERLSSTRMEIFQRFGSHLPPITLESD